MRKIISSTPLGLVWVGTCLLAGCAPWEAPGLGEDARLAVGPKLYSDDFRHGLDQWTVELEKDGVVAAHDGRLEIDVPAGCTVWFRPELAGAVLIEYDATVISAGGPNDRVSDLNCFWMAQDARRPGDLLGLHRSGKFEDYNPLLCYYVGQGGNANTTTRFRRYIGSPDVRPLRTEDDLRAAEFLLTPNVRQHIQLVANGGLIQYYRDGRKIFEFHDSAPYTRGWFALRTTQSHLLIENFAVHRLAAGE